MTSIPILYTPIRLGQVIAERKRVFIALSARNLITICTLIKGLLELSVLSMVFFCRPRTIGLEVGTT